MNDNLSTPTPRERLLEALDPQGDVDLGLAVVIAQDLPDDEATVLAELIDKRIGRVIAALVLAEHVLVAGIRSIAHDRTLPPIEAMGRIRDRFAEHDSEARHA